MAAALTDLRSHAHLSQALVVELIQQVSNDEPFLEPSYLPRSERRLQAAGHELSRAIELFIHVHSDHRTPLDYVAGLIFDYLRNPMRRYYDGEGPDLENVLPARALALLDARLVRAVAALELAFGEVSKQDPGADPDQCWDAACRILALDPFWFA